MDDLRFERLPDETRLSRRRLLGGAGGGFVLAASGLLVPEDVEAEKPVESILNDPRERKDRNKKDRNKKDRNKKDQDKRNSSIGLKHIRFQVFNHTWPNSEFGNGTVVKYYKEYTEVHPTHTRTFWIDAGTSCARCPSPYISNVTPGQRSTFAVEEDTAAVMLGYTWAIIIDNPAFGAPKVYVRIDLPPRAAGLDAHNYARMIGRPKEGESVSWTPETSRKMEIKRLKDTNYKEYLIELRT